MGTESGREWPMAAHNTREQALDSVIVSSGHHFRFLAFDLRELCGKQRRARRQRRGCCIGSVAMSGVQQVAHERAERTLCVVH
jgi:hypothetical protein